MKFQYSSGVENSGTWFGYKGIGLKFNDKEYWLQTLPPSEWHFGYKEMWYDGPIHCFGFIFFEFQSHFDYDK